MVNQMRVGVLLINEDLSPDGFHLFAYPRILYLPPEEDDHTRVEVLLTPMIQWMLKSLSPGASMEDLPINVPEVTVGTFRNTYVGTFRNMYVGTELILLVGV